MNDQELLDKARQLDDEDWNGAFRLAQKAQNPEIRKEIENIARRYYHNEEYRNGDL